MATRVGAWRNDLCLRALIDVSFIRGEVIEAAHPVMFTG
jgi:hypothetical protein